MTRIVGHGIRGFRPIGQRIRAIVGTTVSYFNGFFYVIHVEGMTIVVFSSRSLPNVVDMSYLFFLLPDHCKQVFI